MYFFKMNPYLDRVENVRSKRIAMKTRNPNYGPRKTVGLKFRGPDRDRIEQVCAVLQISPFNGLVSHLTATWSSPSPEPRHIAGQPEAAISSASHLRASFHTHRNFSSPSATSDPALCAASGKVTSAATQPPPGNPRTEPPLCVRASHRETCRRVKWATMAHI